MSWFERVTEWAGHIAEAVRGAVSFTRRVSAELPPEVTNRILAYVQPSPAATTAAANLPEAIRAVGSTLTPEQVTTASQLAGMAYQPLQQARQNTSIRVIADPDHTDRVGALTLRQGGTLYVAFPGTYVGPDGSLDLAQNLHSAACVPTEINGVPGARAHAGWQQLYDRIAPGIRGEVQAAVARGETVIFTGHSLGGALANLAAADMGGRGHFGIVTYGAPRVGDQAFANLVQARCHGNHLRFCHTGDPFTNAPPPGMGFQHAARPIFTDNGHLAVGREPDSNEFSGAITRAAVHCALRGVSCVHSHDSYHHDLQQLTGPQRHTIEEIVVPQMRWTQQVSAKTAVAAGRG